MALALSQLLELERVSVLVAEAMARGFPVIPTDLLSIREFVGSLPLYVRQGDSEGLAAHVDRLLGGCVDPAWPQRAREAVSTLRWSALGERTADLMERLPRPATSRL